MVLEPNSALDQSTDFSSLVTPKRIMLVIHSMQGGGSERQLSYLANELASRFETCLVTLDAGGNEAYDLDPRIERIGLDLATSHGGIIRGAMANRRRVSSLRKSIRAWSPHVLVSFCDSNNILTLLACDSRIPVIISERSDPRHQVLGRLWELLRKYAYPKCFACIAQTHSVAEYLADQGLVAASKIRVIPSAIKMPQDLGRSPNEDPASNSPKTLLYLGRLSREKRVDRLLDAWANLKHHHATWRLNIVGDGAERVKLQQQAIDLKIESSIRWTLWSKDAWQHLRNANAYCLVSQYEGFPQSMLEAMACGLPVAILDCSPAIRETITDRSDGLVIADESQIAKTLDELLTADTLRESLGKTAAERALDFEWSRIAPRWLDVIQSALD